MTASNTPPRIVIATRESRLALWQAEHVKALLQARGHTVELLGMTTQGDQILDRSLSNELKVTQEMIANMLGVRRESITCCAGKLQEEGLIEYRRGTVIILDRHGMERRAGGCYSPS